VIVSIEINVFSRILICQKKDDHLGRLDDFLNDKSGFSSLAFEFSKFIIRS
jgi:hypothetical protein